MGVNYGNQLEADSDDLRVAASTAGDVADKIQGVQTNLQSLVDSSRAQWGGTAGPAFEGAHAAWNTGVSELVLKLRSLGDGVGVTAANYDGTEADVTSRMNAVAGQTPVFHDRLLG
jgi:WXG100 family type VII secretion target